MMHSIGICMGAARLKIVLLAWEDDRYKIKKTEIINHECNPKKAFEEAIRRYKGYDYICITGRRFKDSTNLHAITEPEATEYALRYSLGEKKRYNALASLGAETFILYELDENNCITGVSSGNKCASGTGEFFLQQIRRMDTDIDNSVILALKSNPYRVSGRCSVFCKSDCTHALNKGTAIGEVCAGLGDMIAEKVYDLIRLTEKEGILIVGGVSKNVYVVGRLKEKIRNLSIPDNAEVFEALGAAIYAYKNKTETRSIKIDSAHKSFTQLPPIREFEGSVEWKEHERGLISDGDVCIIGLDVGSTTTKAVLLRRKDSRIISSIYLRTNGNPIEASKRCYRAIREEAGDKDIKIVGLGTTGSGRHISGLHALTDAVINEIIAHATASAFFDPSVDTILEIGGQDAKYTYLVNGVPCDYAMNEACSAGTGSFLEEAAKESLNIGYDIIGDLALKGDSPPNFNDQCAAFISSDIKNASVENISREDIVAGLVYSICMNYNNRVKGSRRIGSKIFMQGGVCYNKAVPIAMAGILNKKIIVPPDPGLMGAFGVALEVDKRLGLGLLEEKEFSLSDLISRKVEYGQSFICKGTEEGCDRKCSISLITLDGKLYPFGGICNKYYNQLQNIRADQKGTDFVEKRQMEAFSCYYDQDIETGCKKPTVGIPKSFLVNTLFPLYYKFFTGLGHRVILSDGVDKSGMESIYSSFCYPAELSHGIFMNLVKKSPDYIFLPQIDELYIKNSISYNREFQSVCVVAQAEPYYLRSAFKNVRQKVISPVINFRKGWRTVEETFVEVGKEIGQTASEAKKSFQDAVDMLEDFMEKKKKLGDKALNEISSDKSKIGIVLFGRPYSAYAEEANMGIPKKFSSRGINIIPFDCLRYEDEKSMENMTWATGQEIIKAARFISRDPQLYGVYITNFSCGPDSFLTGYFRDIMGTKPSLILEIDSHSADAGITTRIEAFLDIVERYRKLRIPEKEKPKFRSASIVFNSRNPFYVTSDGKNVPLRSPDVKVLFPSMGRATAELSAAAFRGLGFSSSEAVPFPSFKTLMFGRSNTSCKECLPLIMTVGSLLDYLSENDGRKELLAYFMPTTPGNCRFSQYYVFLKRLIEKKQIKNVALMTLSSENGYAGLGPINSIKILKSIILADIMDDIKNAIFALAKDREPALRLYKQQYKRLIDCMSRGGSKLYPTLEDIAFELSKIRLKTPLSAAKKVILAGEIYVRKDEFATHGIIERLAKREIVVLRSPVLEWLYYVDYLVKTQYEGKNSLMQKTEFGLRQIILNSIESRIKKKMSQSGLYEFEKIDIDKIISVGKLFVDPRFCGETILNAGTFFKSITSHAHGLISVGPFACLPTRVTEAILTPESKVKDNKNLKLLDNIGELEKYSTLPFLSVECDGNPFPQVVESRIEAFCLQVERLYGSHGPLR